MTLCHRLVDALSFISLSIITPLSETVSMSLYAPVSRYQRNLSEQVAPGSKMRSNLCQSPFILQVFAFFPAKPAVFLFTRESTSDNTVSVDKKSTPYEGGY